MEALQIIPAFCVGIPTLPPTPFLKPYSDQPQEKHVAKPMEVAVEKSLPLSQRFVGF